MFRLNRRRSMARGLLFHRLARQAIALGPAPYRQIIATNQPGPALEATCVKEIPTLHLMTKPVLRTPTTQDALTFCTRRFCDSGSRWSVGHVVRRCIELNGIDPARLADRHVGAHRPPPGLSPPVVVGMALVVPAPSP